MLQLLVNIILSSVIQFVLLSILPFIWWMITARKESTFFKWIGYKKPHIANKKKFWFLIIAIELVFLTVFLLIVPMIHNNDQTATSQFEGLGISAMIPALIYAFFQTAFNEELFFRGFLGKRLSTKLGFEAGNTIQAVLFGMMHCVMFFSSVAFFQAAAIGIFTGLVGWGIGYVNEKASEGSIVPGWLLHGIANTFSCIIALFNLI